MTLVSPIRRQKLVEHLKYLDETGIPGDVLEVGVYKGGTLLTLSQNTRRTVVGVDTFIGMPKPAEIDKHKQGNYSDTSLEKVKERLASYTHCTVIKGEFPHCYWPPNLLAMAHIDVDIYPSVQNCLRTVIKCMSPGGIIVLDDYAAQSCPGARVATHEWLGLNPHAVQIISIVECQLSLKVLG